LGLSILIFTQSCSICCSIQFLTFVITMFIVLKEYSALVTMSP
jgi:hypothetical protein